MGLVRFALALFLTGTASAGGPVWAQSSMRSWQDANGYSWQETRQSIGPRKPATRLARPESHHAATKGRRFGPFVVLDSKRALLSGATDGSSPAAFSAMLAAFPDISTLEMRDCPGTLDDVANLKLGRMIRANGIATVVPEHGSIRSGAVELFIAGQTRKAAHDADFGVHAWQDEQGLGPRDFAMGDPVNKMYLDYYRQMGMQPHQALTFYNLTNAAPNRNVTWLGSAELKKFISIATL